MPHAAEHVNAAQVHCSRSDGTQGALPSRGYLLFHKGQYQLCTWHSSHSNNQCGLTPLSGKTGVKTLTLTLRTAKAMRAGGGPKGQRYVRHGGRLPTKQRQHCYDKWRSSKASRCQEQELPRLLHSPLPSIPWPEDSKIPLEPLVLMEKTTPLSTTLQALTGRRMAIKARRTGTQTGTGGWHREALQQNLCDSGDKASNTCLGQERYSCTAHRYTRSEYHHEAS